MQYQVANMAPTLLFPPSYFLVLGNGNFDLPVDQAKIFDVIIDSSLPYFPEAEQILLT